MFRWNILYNPEAPSSKHSSGFQWWVFHIQNAHWRWISHCCYYWDVCYFTQLIPWKTGIARWHNITGSKSITGVADVPTGTDLLSLSSVSGLRSSAGLPHLTSLLKAALSKCICDSPSLNFVISAFSLSLPTKIQSQWILFAWITHRVPRYKAEF